jgi:hypothetical protein
MKIKLPSGTTGFTNDQGQWICTGSMMGRPTRVPTKDTSPKRLHLHLLPMSGCGDYDKWGAYWGIGTPLYIAWSEDVFAFGDSLQTIQIFTRAGSREAAKRAVLELVPDAKFYR